MPGYLTNIEEKTLANTRFREVLFTGGTCVVMPAFDAAAFLATVQRERITHTFMVPVQFGMVLAQPEFDRTDLGSLQSLLCAGSPLRRDAR